MGCGESLSACVTQTPNAIHPACFDMIRALIQHSRFEAQPWGSNDEILTANPAPNRFGVGFCIHTPDIQQLAGTLGHVWQLGCVSGSGRAFCRLGLFKDGLFYGTTVGS